MTEIKLPPNNHLILLARPINPLNRRPKAPVFGVQEQKSKVGAGNPRLISSPKLVSIGLEARLLDTQGRLHAKVVKSN